MEDTEMPETIGMVRAATPMIHVPDVRAPALRN